MQGVGADLTQSSSGPPRLQKDGLAPTAASPPCKQVFENRVGPERSPFVFAVEQRLFVTMDSESLLLERRLEAEGAQFVLCGLGR